MSQANQTHNLSRRAVLAGSTAALVAAVPVGAALSSPGDVVLLARVARFRALEDEYQRVDEKQRAHRERIEAMPGCPPLNGTVENGHAHIAFLEAHDAFRYCDEGNNANNARGALANVVFETPAETARGVLEKLKIINMALGNHGDDGDIDLEAFQDRGEPWMESVIADLERLTGETRP